MEGGDSSDLSATIGYRLDRWTFTAFGTNLTDQRWEVPIVLGGNAETPSRAASGPLFVVGNTNRPRHIGVELGYEF